MDADAARGRVLLEESRESVVVLDDEDRVIAASRRARESVHGLAEGERLPDGLLSGNAGIVPLVVPYEMSGRRERLVYLSTGGDLTAYEELRAGCARPSRGSCRCSRPRPCPARTSRTSSTAPGPRSSRSAS